MNAEGNLNADVDGTKLCNSKRELPHSTAQILLLSMPTSYRFVSSILAIKILLTEVESLLTAPVGNQFVF